MDFSRPTAFNHAKYAVRAFFGLTLEALAARFFGDDGDAAGDFFGESAFFGDGDAFGAGFGDFSTAFFTDLGDFAAGFGDAAFLVVPVIVKARDQ
jgi:hypothetical protein